MDARSVLGGSSASPSPPYGGGTAPHAHTVQFYGEDAFLLDDVARFVGAALGSGRAAVVFATPAHREGIAVRLARRGLDVDLAVRQGRYVPIDAADVLAKCLQDGRPDGPCFVETVGGVVGRAAVAGESGQPVAVFGELVALLAAEGRHQAAVRLEQLWNDLARSHPIVLHCADPMAAFARVEDGAAMAQICAEHSWVMPTESYVGLPDEDARLRAIALLQQQAEALQTEVEERKRVERALRERNAELSVAVAARDEFLSIAAHELKTPITSLRAYAQLLLRDAQRGRAIEPGRLDAAMSTIEQQTSKLSDLLARLLDAAQIEAGTLRIEPAPTDLAALVRLTVERYEPANGHSVLFDGPPRLEAVVDPARFEQVVAHLVDNAIKFSPDGGTVRVELGRDGRGAIRLSVTDQGVGVPPERRADLFDRFRSAHDGLHLSGLGLGLSITRDIVARHGGAVRIEEPEGVGARFVVELPAAGRPEAESVA